MKEIRLEIIGIFCNDLNIRTASYILLLGESASNRRLPMLIDPNQAKTIASMHREKHGNPQQPCLHDLLNSLLLELGYHLQKVIITAVKQDLYFSSAVFSNGEHTFSIDTRSADAIAISIRLGAPILVYESVLQQTDNVMEIIRQKMIVENQMLRKDHTNPASQIQIDHILIQNIETHPVSILQELLHRVVAREDYYQAARIRDEIKRRAAKDLPNIN